MKVTDEAVEAEFQRWWKASKYCQVILPQPHIEQCARDGFRAAVMVLPHLSQEAVSVKPLEWESGVVDWAKPQPGMKYVACSTTPQGSWAWWLDDAPETRAVFSSENEAKAAAQADYERRIMSAVASYEPAPTDTQEGVSEAGEVVAWAWAYLGSRHIAFDFEPDRRSLELGQLTDITPLVRQSALTACQQEVERLRERSEKFKWQVRDTCRRAEAAEARNAELVKALEPFTQFFDKAMEGFTEGYADRQPEEKPVLGWNDAQLLMADFNRARAALGGQNNEA